MCTLDGEGRCHAPTIDRNGDIMRQRHSLGALIGASILAIAAACTPQATLAAGSPKHTVTNLKPCSLLTGADVKSVFHSNLLSPPAVGAVGAFWSCTFVVKTKMVPFYIADEASIRARTKYKTLAAYWKTTTTTHVVKVHTPVKGVGDAAVFLPSLGEFWVLKGKYMFAIGNAPTRPGTLTQLEDLARRVMKRLH
jgi:hypothetical protein